MRSLAQIDSCQESIDQVYGSIAVQWPDPETVREVTFAAGNGFTVPNTGERAESPRVLKRFYPVAGADQFAGSGVERGDEILDQALSGLRDEVPGAGQLSNFAEHPACDRAQRLLIGSGGVHQSVDGRDE